MRIVCKKVIPPTVMGKEREQLIGLCRGLFLHESLLINGKVLNYNLPKLDEQLEDLLIEATIGYVAKVDGKAVGMLLNSHENPYSVRALYVHEDYRSGWVGESLIGLFRQSKFCRGQVISVSVLEANERALSFYRRVGFTFNDPSYLVNDVPTVRGYMDVNV